MGHEKRGRGRFFYYRESKRLYCSQSYKDYPPTVLRSKVKKLGMCVCLWFLDCVLLFFGGIEGD